MFKQKSLTYLTNVLERRKGGTGKGEEGEGGRKKGGRGKGKNLTKIISCVNQLKETAGRSTFTCVIRFTSFVYIKI